MTNVAACAEACGEQEGRRYFTGRCAARPPWPLLLEKTTAACEGSRESFYDGASGFKRRLL